MAQVPLSVSQRLREVCEILDSVVRAFRAEVTRKKELEFCLHGARGSRISLQGPVRLINRSANLDSDKHENKSRHAV